MANYGTHTEREEKSSKLKATDKRITYVQDKIKELHDKMAINVDNDLHKGLVEIMDNHTMEIKKDNVKKRQGQILKLKVG